MAITKKIRFEVFKRDGFKCAYCGQSPPAVVLEADHIDPKAKGGKDDINNLITACFSCNRGKRDIPLDKITNQMQENLEILKEKESQLKEYRRFVEKVEMRIWQDIEDLNSIYNAHFPKYEFSDKFKAVSLKRFLELLPKHVVVDALNNAIHKFSSSRRGSDTVIPYFCGICWNIIKGKGR